MACEFCVDGKCICSTCLGNGAYPPELKYICRTCRGSGEVECDRCQPDPEPINDPIAKAILRRNVGNRPVILPSRFC